MGFRSLGQLAESQAEAGRFWQQHFFKTTQPTTLAGAWTDTSIGSGIPVYNAYLGVSLEFTPLTGARNSSIYLGPNTGSSKYVATAQLGTSAASVPIYSVFADYLGFYPLVDLDDTATQIFDNTASLPRYSDGEGVCAFIVMQTPGAALNASCTISYTNSDGVSGRSVTFGVLSAANIGVLVGQGAVTALGAALTPFIPMASGDRGIRSIQDITLSTGIGGFANIVLCKPIFNLQVLEQNTVAEKVFFKESGTLPEVREGAFLQFLALRASATAAQPIRGFVDFTWS